MQKIDLFTKRMNDQLFSDLILSILEGDKFSADIINTRIATRYNTGLIEEADIQTIYPFLIEGVKQ